MLYIIAYGSNHLPAIITIWTAICHHNTTTNMQSIRELFTIAYNTLRRGGIAHHQDDGKFHICERLRFVRLPSSLLPQSNAKISLTGSKGDNKRLLRFWPCIVYETLDELLHHVQGADKDKVLNDHKSRASVKVVARLIAWKDRPMESPKLLLRPDNQSSCGGYDLGEVTLVRLHGDSLGHNEEEDHGELLSFFDSQLELEDLMDGVISELGMHLYDKSSNDLYTHAVRFRTAVDLTLNLLAESLGTDPLPLRQPNYAQQLVTPSPRKRSRHHHKGRTTSPTMPTPCRPNKQNKSSSERDLHQRTNTAKSDSMDVGMALSDPVELSVTNLPNTPEFDHSSNLEGPGAPRKPRRNESLASQGDFEVNENLLDVFDKDGNVGLDPVARDDLGGAPSIGANSDSVSRSDDSVEGQDGNPATPESNHLPEQNPGAIGGESSPADQDDSEEESSLEGSIPRTARNRTSQKGNEAKAKSNGNGSRLVWNKDLSGAIKVKNERTCLPDAIRELLHPRLKDIIYESMISNMAADGDTSIKMMNTVLKGYGLTLKHVTSEYKDKSHGSLAYELLQETDCKLVIRIKLKNHRGQPMWHCVGWNGKVIYDRPKKSIVNGTTDRRDRKGSEDVFHKLYPKKWFLDWQITNVYMLVTCPTTNDKANITSQHLIDIAAQLSSTSLTEMNKLIERNGLVLKNSINTYEQCPGTPRRLLNEENCRIIFRMKLSDINDHSKCCFVAWDGSVMYCVQNRFPVNEGDRSSKRGCLGVFRDIAAQYKGRLWRIDRVYTLECLGC